MTPTPTATRAATPRATNATAADRFRDGMASNRTLALQRFFDPPRVDVNALTPTPTRAPEPVQTQLIHHSQRVSRAQAAIDRELGNFQAMLSVAHPLLTEAQQQSALQNFRAENAALYTELESAKRDLVAWASANKEQLGATMRGDPRFADALVTDLASVAGSTSNEALLSLLREPALVEAFSANPATLQRLRDEVLAPAMQGLALESLATSPQNPASALEVVEQTLSGLNDLYGGLDEVLGAIDTLTTSVRQGPAALARQAAALADSPALGGFGDALGSVAAFFSFAMAGQNAAAGDLGAAARSLIDGMANAEQMANVAQLAARVVTNNPTALANVVRMAPAVGSVFAVAGAVIDTLSIDGSRPSTLAQAAGSWSLAGAAVLVAAGSTGVLAPALLVLGLGAQFVSSHLQAGEREAELRRVLGGLTPPLPSSLIDGVVAYGGQRLADGFRSVLDDPQQLGALLERMETAAAGAYPGDPTKAADLMRRYLEAVVRSGGDADALRRELRDRQFHAQPIITSPRPGERAAPNVEFDFWALAGA